MTKHRSTFALIGGICALTLAAAATPALAGTTYLSRTGSGATCTLAAPCTSMNLAVGLAGANGEVICLDKGNYGGVTITQFVTISCGDGLWEAPGSFVMVTTPSFSGASIEGLIADGAGLSPFAANIVVNGGGLVILRRVRIGNNPGGGNHGVVFQPNGPATLHITDSVFYSNGGAGLLIQPTGSASVQAAITRTAFESNNLGIVADETKSTGQVQVQVNDSVVANNTNTGVSAQAGSALVVVSLSNSKVVGNQTGVAASGSLGVVILDRTTVQANTVQALSSTGGSAIYSYGNNPINDNGALGSSPTVIGLH
jgi:hypothetical protein